MSFFKNKRFPTEAGLHEALTIKNFTVSVEQLLRYPLEEVVPFSTGSLIYMEGLTVEEDQLEYAQDKSIVFLNMLYRNDSDKVIEAFGTQWRLQDTAGYIHKVTSIDGSIHEALNLPTLVDTYLNPGRMVRGWLTFVVKNDIKIAYVTFTTGFLGGRTLDFIVPEDSDRVLHLDKRDLTRDQLH